MVSIVLGLLLGFFYFQISDSLVGQQDRIFLLFVSSVIMGRRPVHCVIAVTTQGVRLTAESITFFAEEKNVIIPELENGIANHVLILMSWAVFCPSVPHCQCDWVVS